MPRHTGTELRISGNVWWSHGSKFTFFGLKSSSRSIVRQGVDIYMVEAASGFGAAVVLDPDAVFILTEKRRKSSRDPKKSLQETQRKVQEHFKSSGCSRIKTHTPNIDFPAVPCLFAQFNKLLHPFSKHSLKKWGFCTVCNCKLVHN